MWMRQHYLPRVSPFGYPRINACKRLPGAFRSLLRPSSPASAKASTVCPFALDHILPANVLFSYSVVKEHLHHELPPPRMLARLDFHVDSLWRIPDSNR